MYRTTKHSMNILSHWFASLSEFGVRFFNTPDLLHTFIFYNILPSGAIIVYRKAMCKNIATDPKLGKKVSVPPFYLTKLFPFGSVGVHLQSIAALLALGALKKGSKKSNCVIMFRASNRKEMVDGHATLL